MKPAPVRRWLLLPLVLLLLPPPPLLLFGGAGAWGGDVIVWGAGQRCHVLGGPGRPKAPSGAAPAARGAGQRLGLGPSSSDGVRAPPARAAASGQGELLLCHREQEVAAGELPSARRGPPAPHSPLFVARS